MRTKEISRSIDYVMVVGSLFLGASALYDFFQSNPLPKYLTVMLPSGGGFIYGSGELRVLRKAPCMLIPANSSRPYALKMAGAESAVVTLPLSSLMWDKVSFDDYRLFDATKCKYPII